MKKRKSVPPLYKRESGPIVAVKTPEDRAALDRLCDGDWVTEFCDMVESQARELLREAGFPDDYPRLARMPDSKLPEPARLAHEALLRARQVRSLQSPTRGDLYAAMQLGAAWERCRASNVFARPADLGRRLVAGGRKGAARKGQPVHSSLIAWARRELAGGMRPRELVSAAREAGRTSLSDKQVRTIFQRAGLVPKRRKGS